MTKALTFLSALFLVFSVSAQTVTKRIVTINGGQFGNQTNNANISSFDPETGVYSSIDTIQTQSIQDVLVEGRTMYVAAQDSIVKYNVVTGDRIAAAAFGAPSTISMSTYNDYLLVGNWYAPFGQVGPYTNHFRIFDKNTLTYVDSIPEIHQGVKSFVVVGDTAYIGQNYTSSAFSDSAGWMVKVDLVSLTYSDSVAVNDMEEDFGRLIEKDGMVIGLNSASNTVTIYDPLTGTAMTDTANADLSLRTYGSQFVVDQYGTLHTKVGDNIATYDPISRSVIDGDIVDTAITAFTLDTVNQRYYVTQTDFFSYTGGLIYDTTGQRVDTFLVGSSPEAIVAIYNELPVAVDDQFHIFTSLPNELSVLNNDYDLDGDSLIINILSYTTNTLDSVNVKGNQIAIEVTSNTFIAVDTIFYEIIDEWGDSDTAMLEVWLNTGSITNLLDESLVSVFPIPSNDLITIEIAANWEGIVMLFDLNGKLIIEEKLGREQSLVIDIEELNSGIYFLQGIGKQGNWQKKIIKE